MKYVLRQHASNSQIRYLKMLTMITSIVFCNGILGSGSTSRQANSEILGSEVGAIAIVNGVTIGNRRFNAIYERALRTVDYTRNLRSIPMAIRTKMAIARRLIDSELLRQHARQLKVTISGDELKAATTAFVASFPSLGAYQQYLSQQPMGEASVELLLLDKIISEKLLDALGMDPVSEEEARVYYGQHLSAFNVPPHLIIREIVVRDLPTAERVAAAIKDGQDFSQLARRFSEAESAKMGGYPGRTTESNTHPIIWSALQLMVDGETSDLLKTSEGIHIVTRLGSRPASEQPFEDVVEQIRRIIATRRRAAKYANLLRELRTSATIENRIQERYAHLLDVMTLPLGQPAFGDEHTVTEPIPHGGSSPGGAGGLEY